MEDDAALRTVLAELLEAEGYVANAARGGLERFLAASHHQGGCLGVPVVVISAAREVGESARVLRLLPT